MYESLMEKKKFRLFCDEPGLFLQKRSSSSSNDKRNHLSFIVIGFQKIFYVSHIVRNLVSRAAEQVDSCESRTGNLR